MDKKQPLASVSTLRCAEEPEVQVEVQGKEIPAEAPLSTSQPIAKENTGQAQIWRNLSSVPLLLSSFLTCLIFSLLYCLFIYHVLIRQHPQVGGVLFDGPTSNLLISIFSQVFALLSESMIRGLLDTLRTTLADREKGTSASAFFGISAATGWLSVFRIASVDAFRDVWCDLRLLVPALGLLFGSILKFQATFDYYFSSSDIKTPVYAGLVPIDIRLLSNIRTTDLWVYFQSFTSILLAHPRYSVPFPLQQCDGNCTAFLMPGGLEMLRQVSPHLNLTAFHGGIFDNVEVIRVEDSRGITLVYERMDPKFEFDWSRECIYPGEQLKDGVQLCLKQDGKSVIAGWTSCPQQIFDFHECSKNTSWTGTPMEWTTKMTAYFQFATVTYNRNNGSIVDIKPSPAGLSDQITLSAADYITLFSRLLIPSPGETDALVTTKINSIIYDLTWLHRTYQVSFPDQKDTPTSYLRNFLAVPLQFAVVATSFANYSIDPDTLKAFFGGDGLPLPEVMRTVAVGGKSTTMLLIKEWTGWAFIGGAIAMLLVTTGGIVWVLSRPVKVVGRIGIPELDILRVGGWDRGEENGVERGGQTKTWAGEPTSRGLTDLPGGTVGRDQCDASSWKLAAALKYWRVVSVKGDGGADAALIAVPSDTGGKKRGLGG
ncbi:hypothetical protein B0H67DRAFT_563305 [Lasiosphaeris hirsuta]|uniref:Uncharacterized protein n=1 Tax=Lasiosphaeris hirsuta TaxID=260670 RepID=A0AA40BB19_9PEZI|nr:hypothetical protein B0H67DRAFT_563305 [Lasiosphaeris hirsuta]